MGKGITSRVAMDSLLRKGFQSEWNSGHAYFYFYYKGQQTHINTHFSNGSNEDIGDELLRRIKMQLKLDTIKEVARFLSCEMDEAEYQNKLLAKGLFSA